MVHADTSTEGDRKDPLTAALDTLPIAILLVDKAWTIQWINKEGEALFGRGRADLIGRSIESAERGLWVWSDRPILDEVMAVCLDHGRRVCKEHQEITILRDHNRKHHPMKVTASPLLVADERLALLVLEGVVPSQDRKNETERLHLALKTARMTAHELNQPLSVLVGHIELLMKQLDADNPVKTRINKMSESADRLAKTVHRLQMIIRTVKEPGLMKTSPMHVHKESSAGA
jgi:PAS domain S-box-containing protein